MRGPGIPHNETRSALVNNLDVVATIAELAEGRARLRAGRHARSPRSSPTPMRRGGARILFESPITRFQKPDARFTGVRTATRKYVKYASGFEELFDL